jgi:hypothetical protein
MPAEQHSRIIHLMPFDNLKQRVLDGVAKLLPVELIRCKEPISLKRIDCDNAGGHEPENRADAAVRHTAKLNFPGG